MGRIYETGRSTRGKLCGCCDDFKAFISRGNVVDLAVGMIIGAAFTAIVKSLVADIFTPIISLATGGATMAEMFVILKYGVDADKLAKVKYHTIDEAKSRSAITLNYGRFLMTIFNFLLVALCLFVMIKLIYCCKKKEEPEPSTDWPCPKCQESVKEGAVRCPHCTAEPIAPKSD